MSLFTYVRRLNPSPSNINFITSKTDTSHFLVLPFIESFRIYDCRKLNVVFQGPLTPKYNCMALCNDHVIIAGEDDGLGNSFMHFYYRSSLVLSLGIGAEQLISFGDYFICLFKNEILFYEFIKGKEPKLVNTIRRENIIKIHHVPTYVNKVLIIYKEGIEIYNFVREKTIFKSDVIKGCMTIESSPVLDVVAMACEDSIYLYNLKQDKIMFALNYKGSLSRMSFHTNGHPLLIAVIDNTLNLYHLEEQRWLVQLGDNILDASFLAGEDLIVAKKRDSMQLYLIENYKLRSIKERLIFGKVNKMQEYNEDLILSTNNGIYSCSLLRDELNFKFKIKRFSNPEGIKIGGENIIVFSGSNTLLLSHSNKNSQVVMESYKNMFIDVEISSCGNFGVLRTKDSLIIHNFKSKMIYKKINIEPSSIGLAFDIFQKKIIVCYESRLLIIDDNYAIEYVPLDLKIRLFKYKNNFCAFATKECVSLFDIENRIISRLFLVRDATDFCISDDFSLIAISNSDSVQVFDVRTQKPVYVINSQSSGILFTTSNRYLCVLLDGNVDLYFNNSVFDEELTLPVFNQVKDIKPEISYSIRNNFIEIQKDLNHRLLNEEYDEELMGLFQEEYLEWKKVYEETVAYIEFEKRNNIL